MMESIQQISLASSSTIAKETEILKKIFVQQVPKFLSSYRSIELEPGASPHLKAFWETLGWSNVFKGLMAEPELNRSRKATEQILTKYREDDYFTITINDLPSQFRLLTIDNQGVGFSITDESDNLLDPPVKCIINEKNAIFDDYPSYLRWLANTLILEAFPYRNPWECSQISIDPEPKGEKVLPILSPATVKLTDEIWMLPRFIESISGEYMVYKDFQFLIDYLYSLKLEKIKLYAPYINHPSMELSNININELLKLEPQLYVIVDYTNKNNSHILGYINGIPLWLEVKNSNISDRNRRRSIKIYFSRKDKIEVEKLIIERRWANNS